MNAKIRKTILAVAIIAVILFLLIFISPLLVMHYAEKQYFVDQYRKNRTAFEDVKDELLLTLEKENASELNLIICHDSENGRLLQHYDRAIYSVDYSHPIDANGKNYDIIDKSFGDYSFSKIYVTKNYVCLSEEGNNYQYIYSSEYTPESAHYAGRDTDKIYRLGGDWYLITPE